MNETESHASIYRKAVREARRAEEARIAYERREDDERIARTLAKHGGKPFRCPFPTAFRRCMDECRGCCTLSYIAPNR